MWHKKQQQTFFTQQFERLIPEDDKFRVIKENVDFSFINELARPYYSDLGPTGYPPDKLFRCLLVMFLEGITSERKLEQELKFNIRYRYFCDLDIYDPIPDHATFSVLRDRLGTEIFYRIFERIASYAAELGFVRPKHVSIDSTSVIADCARPKKGTPKNEVADPDATRGIQGTKTTHFGYKAHHLVDSHTDFILAVDTTTAASPDLASAKAMVPTLIKRGIHPDYLAADKAYSDSAFRYELKEKRKYCLSFP